ncbi:uncharacterized protein LOC133172503 [Saccostrea echinata]|uniref:uncharacterized protein LOC133172503 n=1 Tax=Saccostrea echinata TaxID=191078 RepID=UPI002A81708C|nr:uncharacterized protein LOC133172503 [Saccostrea echinata]
MKIVSASGFSICLIWTLLIFTSEVLSDVEEESLGDNKCVYIKGRRVIDIVTVPCTEKIKASCGWFSISYCTMYRKTYCKKELNSTKILYYKSTECCKGFVRTPNNTCINETTLDPELRSIIENATDKDVDEDFIVDPKDVIKYETAALEHESPVIHKTGSAENSINLSQGAYAGIACALLFLGVVAVFVGIAIRKKRLRNRRNKKSEGMRDCKMEGGVMYQTTPIVKTRHSSKSSVSEEIERLHPDTEET